jgi:hypothetical protein
MHLLLETLVVVVRADGTAAAAWEPALSPAVLALWADNVADPLLSVDALDVLQALANTPAALPSLQARTAISLLSMPGTHTPGRHWLHSLIRSILCMHRRLAGARQHLLHQDTQPAGKSRFYSWRERGRGGLLHTSRPASWQY